MKAWAASRRSPQPVCAARKIFEAFFPRFALYQMQTPETPHTAKTRIQAMTQATRNSVRTRSLTKEVQRVGRLSRLLSGMFAILLSGMALPALAQTAPPLAGSDKARVEENYGKIPLNFEPNRGQTDTRVQFIARGQGYGLFLTPGEAVLSLEKPSPAASKQPILGKNGSRVAPPRPETSLLRMTLLGANLAAPVTGEDRLAGTSNYFMGQDAKRWATGVPNYGKVSYVGVYPGVDLVYYGNQRQLEYDFVVAPNANPSQIALNFTGATPKLDTRGNLVLSTAGGVTTFHKPVVYQWSGEEKLPIQGSYQIAKNTVSFALGSYDHAKELVIDPVLTYGTFLGGSSSDAGVSITADASGNAYIVGDTTSLDFPLVNAYQSTNHNASNGFVVFVTKLNPTGTAAIYSTFLGGVADSHATGVAVNATGNAFIVGYTSAGDFPVTLSSYQPICGGAFTSSPTGVRIRSNGCGPAGDLNGFVTMLTPSGSALVYSTFLGGNGSTAINAIALDSAGDAFLAGNTGSFCGAGPYYPTAPGGYSTYQCFPTTAGALQTGAANLTGGGTLFAFLAVLDATGSTEVYGTLYGDTRMTSSGFAPTYANAVAVDAAGNGYIAGQAGLFVPTSAGAYLTALASPSLMFPPRLAFVAKFNPFALSSTAALVYGTYLGSNVQSANAVNYTNTITGMAVDATGNAYVAGYTGTCGYPTTAGAYQTVGSSTGIVCNDSFVTKLNPTGTGLVWSTLLGSNATAFPSSPANTQINSLSLGANGNIYVAGTSSNYASSYPQVGSLRPGVNGGAILSELDATGSKLVYSTFLSGYSSDTAMGLATDANGNMYLTGRVQPVPTGQPTIPTTTGALSTTYKGGTNDAYVVKIAPFIVSTTTATLPSGTVTAGQPVVFTATVAGPTGTTTVPTGSVTFLSGSTTLGTGTLNSSGAATYTAPSLNATTYSVTASYPGDANFYASVSSVASLVVSPATAIATLTAPASALPGGSVTLSVKVTGASGTPTGSVTFKDGTSPLATVALTSGAASYTSIAFAAGSHSLTASYTGDSIFGSSTSSTQTLVVSLITPTVTLTAPSTALVGASVALSVAVSGAGGTPTGSVTFKDGATTLNTATLTAGAASYSTTPLAAGAHTITASYTGDSTFAAAISAASTVTINVPASIAFTASPASLTIVHGASGSIVITGTPAGGYVGTATFTCGSLPTSATCGFSPSTLTYTATSTAQTTTLTLSTATTASLDRPSLGDRSPGIFAAFLLLPLGLLVRGRKRKGQTLLLLALVLVSSAMMLGLSGCSSGTSSASTGTTTTTTPAGFYTVVVTVTATGGNMTLNVPITVQ